MDEYDRDYCLWAQHQALLLRRHSFNELDLPNLIEEVESMGR